MSHQNIDDILEELADLEDIPPVRNMPPPRNRAGQKHKPPGKLKQPAEQVIEQLMEQEDGQSSFNFTYHASRHERLWLVNSLGDFYEHQWLDDVLRLVKGGKEANVYQCRANASVAGLKQPLIAAKLYRPRQFRALKKDYVYRERRANLDSDGNLIGDDGRLHAIEKRTTYGLDLLQTSWIEYEFQALSVLHSAGADVPVPLERGNNVILMSFVGDEEMAAPTLNSIELHPKEARRLFERVLHNVDLMLAHNRVHADLSAYNILYWEGEITLIDFPQVIDPQVNPQAFKIFERDIIRVCEYFGRQGVKSNPRRLAADFWRAYHHRITPEIHPALLNADDEADRAYWQKSLGGG